MTQNRLALGAWGEEQAISFLRSKKYRILESNFRTPVGEIDIIARSGKYLVFVEVKTRRSYLFGTPQEAVGTRKQRQIIRTAQWYLQQHSSNLQPRFDVIAIVGDNRDNLEITHLTDAFSE